MKTKNRLSRVTSGVKNNTKTHLPSDYFAVMAETSAAVVEHCAVPEFLNRCRVRNPEDIIRFGDKARRLADSLLLAWVTATNDSLGVVRCLPVPLMKYLYGHMAPQFGWPPIVAELEDIDRGHRDELRRTEGARKTLESAAIHAHNPEVTAALTTVLTWLESETRRLRGESSPSPAPLRSI